MYRGLGVAGEIALAPTTTSRSSSAIREIDGQLVNGGAVRPTGAEAAALTRGEHVQQLSCGIDDRALYDAGARVQRAGEIQLAGSGDEGRGGADPIQEAACVRHKHLPRRRIVHRASESRGGAGIHLHWPPPASYFSRDPLEYSRDLVKPASIIPDIGNVVAVVVEDGRVAVRVLRATRICEDPGGHARRCTARIRGVRHPREGGGTADGISGRSGLFQQDQDPVPTCISLTNATCVPSREKTGEVVTVPPVL